jgi:hypothetical protein
LDALSTLLITVGIAKWNGDLGAAGLASFAFGPPILHMVHGQVWKGLYDLGLLRVAGPFLSAGLGATIGMLIGAKTGCGGGDSDLPCGSVPGLVIGLGAGMVAAVAVDASVFSWESRPATTNSPPKGGAFGPSVVPTITLVHDDRNRFSAAVIGIEGTLSVGRRLESGSEVGIRIGSRNPSRHRKSDVEVAVDFVGIRVGAVWLASLSAKEARRRPIHSVQSGPSRGWRVAACA